MACRLACSSGRKPAARDRRARTAWDGAWLAIGVLALVAGCGRIGVELLSLQDGDARPNEGGMEGGAGGSDDGGAPGADSGSKEVCPAECENPHGTAQCVDGACMSTCALGYGDCDGIAENGCETSTSGSIASCGSCTTTCANEHGTTACTDGLCVPNCELGFDDCDGDPANGCESDLDSTEACGTCSVTCSNPHGTTRCDAGACVPTCDAGYSDCDGDPANGCETDLRNDPMHCGTCPSACSTDWICVDGACEPSPCPSGFGECDGSPAVTCETHTQTSIAHCGFCNNACTTANGSPACEGGTCQVGSCDAHYDDCDDSPGNGCETDLSLSTAHCGACDAPCTNPHGTTQCMASSCVPACSTGWKSCDGNARNGCETSINTVSNCGDCRNICPAVTGGTPVCNSGVCGAICDLTGTWALKIALNVTWNSQDYVYSGSGRHQFWLRLQSTHTGNNLSGSMTECGRVVPDFDAGAFTVRERVRFELPNSLFDSGNLPSYAASVTLGGSSPGATLDLPYTAFLIGMENFANPTTASWPSSAGSLDALDMDGDGNPGATVMYVDADGGGNTYYYPRTGSSLFSYNRADRAYAATRLVFSLDGALASCTEASGPADVRFIDTSIFGCRRTSGSHCSSSEGNFLDNGTVQYNLGSATYTLVKVGSGASCADVRAALP